MADEKSFENDVRKLRKRRKRKRFVKNLLLILAVLVFASGVYFSRGLWLPYFEGILERGFADDRDAAAENFPIDISNRTNVRIGGMDNCWVMFSDTSLSVRDNNGRELHSVYLPYSSPVVETSSRRTLVYDMGGYNLCVVSRTGEVFSKRLENQILFAVVGEHGNIAVVTSTDKYASYLTIYDKNGTEVFHWADGNLITAIALDDSGDGCIVSSSYVLGGRFKSVVSELDFSMTEIVGKTIPVNTLCLDIEYTRDNGFWLIGDSALYRYGEDFSLSYTYEYIYDLTKYAVSGDVCGMVFNPAGTNSIYLTLFDAELEQPTEITYNEKIHSIEAYDGKIYFNTSTRLNSVDSLGMLVGTSPLDAEYESFVVNGDKAFLLGYRSINKAELTTHD